MAETSVHFDDAAWGRGATLMYTRASYHIKTDDVRLTILTARWPLCEEKEMDQQIFLDFSLNQHLLLYFYDKCKTSDE